MHSRERRRTPSFSSILLDNIYRSIDESKTDLVHEENHDNKTNKHREKGCIGKQRMNLRQAVMIEDWLDKNTSSSSSECSSGGIFSSSETDSTNINKPRSRPQKHMNHDSNSQRQQQHQKKKKKKKQQPWEDGFTRTKLKALKIYGELNQKVRQPISPGSKIATFLSSIFNSQNVKKAKMCYVGAVEDVSFDHKSKSPCFSSTVSSFSTRSCMTKTTSKSNNGVKRSVRFYPVSVILGEDSETKQQTSVRKITKCSSVKEAKNINSVILEKENGDEAIVHGFMKGYNKSCDKGEFDFRGFYNNGEDDNEEDEDDDDDAVSYSSSDLFELDHLIGGERYQEELPVYETTNLETNKAIANGLCL